jgi:DHA1 family bicyclomycin/chloramphenicol resistance-like MFS transporter
MATPARASRLLDPDQPGMTLLLGALIAVSPLAMDIYLASMPSMSQALHAPAATVQLTLSMYMYAWGVAQLAAGPLSDRFGRRPALIAGLVVLTPASLACARCRTVEALIAARVVQAVAVATVAVVPRAIVRDRYSGDRAAHVLSLMGVVLGIAPIVAPILGGNLHLWLGWQANFVLVALYALVLLVIVVLRLPETHRERNLRALSPPVLLGNYAALLRSRLFVGYLLVAGFTSSGLFAFLAGSSYVFEKVMGHDARGFGVLFGSVMLGTISGAVASSRVVRRWGIERTIARASWLLLGAGLSLAALAWADVRHPLAVVLPMFAFMFAFMMTMPPATAGGLTPFPRIAGSASSLLSFGQFAIASTGALITGLTFDGSARPMATTIAVSAVLAVVAFRLLVVPAIRGGAATPG